MSRILIRASNVGDLFGRVAVQSRMATEEQIKEGLRQQELAREGGRQVSLGTILLERGILTMEQVEKILDAQQTAKLKRDDSLYGRIAVQNGFITDAQLKEVLREQEGTGKRLGELLIGKGLITSQRHHAVMAAQSRIKQHQEALDKATLRERQFEIEGDVITIGRAPDSSLQLLDSSVSRRHCRVERTSEGYRIADCGSALGIRINGVRTQSAILKPGDIITLGLMMLTFEELPQAPKAAAQVERRAATAVPYLAPEPIAVPEPLPVPFRPTARGLFRVRRRSQVSSFLTLFGTAAAVVLLVYFIVKPSGDQDDKEASTLLSEAWSLRQSERLEEALEAYKAIVRKFPSSGEAAKARSKIAEIEGLFALEKTAAAELLTLSSRKAISIEDMVSQLDELKTLVQRFPATLTAREAASRATSLEGIMREEFQRILAQAEREIEQSLSAGNFAQAQEKWNIFKERWSKFPGLDCGSAVDDALVSLDKRARQEFTALVSRSDSLVAAQKTKEAAELLAAGLARFAGTPYAAKLVSKQQEILSAIAAADSSPERALAEKRERELFMRVAAEAEAFRRQRLFAKAVEVFSQLAKEISLPELLSEHAETFRSLQRQASLFSRLVAAINLGSLRPKTLALQGETEVMLLRADDEEVEAHFKAGSMRLKWNALTPATLLELYSRLGPSADDFLAMAELAYESKLEADGNELIHKAVKSSDAARNEAMRIVARYRRLAVPPEGFVYHKGKWLTPEEAEALAAQARFDGLLAKIVSQDPKVHDEGVAEAKLLPQQEASKLVAVLQARDKKFLSKLRIPSLFGAVRELQEARIELYRRRNIALVRINNATLYTKEIGQGDVDKLVESVRKAYTNPSSIPRLSSTLAQQVRQLQATKKTLGSLGVQQPDFDLYLWSLYQLSAGPLDVKSFALEWEPRNMLEYNRRVLAENEKKKNKVDRDVFICIEKTNEYRMLQGMHALWLDERLCAAAHKHSAEMSSRGVLDHYSLNAESKTPTHRAAREGYSGLIGENIAMGMYSGDEAFLGWYHSAPHHRNMLVNSYTDIGVGTVGGYWTMALGAAGRRTK